MMRGTTQESTRKTVQKTTQEDVGTARGRRERLREQTDRKIMKATLGIVISDGIGAVTIEEVARRSGVAKTTIYRRYRNADDLLQRIQPEVAGLPNFNDLKPSRNGLATMLQRIQDCFDSELGLKAVGVVLSSDNATLKAIAAQVLAPAEERFVGFMERGIADGVFQNRLDYTFLFSTVLGSMLACKALAGQEAGGERQSGKERKPDSWAENMATLLWPNVCAESAR